MTTTDTQTLPLLPLSSGVVLPGMVVTLALESDEANAAATAAELADRTLVLVPKRAGGGFADVGTVARIEDVGALPNGLRGAVVRGLRRAHLGAGAADPHGGAATWVEVRPVESGPASEEAHRLARELRATVEAILDRRRAARMVDLFGGVSDPGEVADTAGYWPDLSYERKVELLEVVDVEQRLRLVLEWAKEHLADLELKEHINHEVNEGLEKRQREFLLRQQLTAIRKELGELSGDEGEDGDAASRFRRLLDERELPEAVAAAVTKELARFERMSEQSPERGWVQTWLEWVFDVPWGVRAEDRLDLEEAQAVLDADHTGLDDVKERILEHLAVRKLRAEREAASEEAPVPGPERPFRAGSIDGRRGSGAILTLVGPPGVGKTSLGESVARALGRPFVRVALGGVRDEAEIRGHRRTYVGAQPGRLVRAMKEAGAMNPVILLDEVDKLGGDWRGDPASALLEVLDPAQNHTFADHYLEVELDLSDVLFLATANQLETVAGPLLDRMEVVSLDGYTEDEKVAIARDHLLRRQRAAAGLRDGEVTVDDGALRSLVREHTREAGVRSLERALARLLRKVATRIARGGEGGAVAVDASLVRELLGKPRFRDEVPERTSVAGVATGLAVTGVGGDVLFVEATSMPGEGGSPGLTVTGQLGDVMKESAQIALSFVRSRADELGCEADGFDGRRFHVHFPAGAVPKDGPSAGVTMTTALVSLLTGRLVKPTLAMTGEVTLQGKVLPIGGVKQKVLAAHRAGLTEVLLPKGNEADLDDIPEAIRAELTIHLCGDVREVLELALEPLALAA
ncbi:MAG: ATP-dependent protease La Type I [uncultured Acidimicrobiales bacterium]|uniref:Lon protease n=1 Tax=uncultured Acidimicrobiales bacterium TaxID=310071 RepID=A0A6J4J3T0_9ACTN|nr:MAG: ATP-dependent protease La Type I [uncultured Acidimicrobiales bacterium]